MTTENQINKPQRQHRIATLLTNHSVSSQTHLVELLDGEGIKATQATVSRDLEELGAVKLRGADGGTGRYVVPDDGSPDHLRRVLSEWVIDVASSGNLVVLRTPPGSAHVVASALDRSTVPLEGVLGTVAGDDTLLVIAEEGTTGAELAARLRAVAGLPNKKDS